MNGIYMIKMRWDLNAASGIAALLSSVLMGSMSEPITYLPCVYIFTNLYGDGNRSHYTTLHGEG